MSICCRFLVTIAATRSEFWGVLRYRFQMKGTPLYVLISRKPVHSDGKLVNIRPSLTQYISKATTTIRGSHYYDILLPYPCFQNHESMFLVSTSNCLIACSSLLVFLKILWRLRVSFGLIQVPFCVRRALSQRTDLSMSSYERRNIAEFSP